MKQRIEDSREKSTGVRTTSQVYFSNTHERAYFTIKKEWGKEPLHISVYMDFTCTRHHPKLHHLYIALVVASGLAHRSTTWHKSSVVPLSNPAFFHACPSLLIRSSTTFLDGEAPSKTIAFLCFHNSHITSVKRVLTSLQAVLFLTFSAHQSYSEVGRAITHSNFPKARQSTVHASLAKTPCNRMCWMDSSSWSQKGHASWWSNPRRANL